MNKDEAKYIAQTLLSDRSTGDTPLRRDNNDPLRKFIAENVKNMSTMFNADVSSTNVFDNKPYQDLERAFNDILSMSVTNEKELYDQYTALVILKNKSVSLFRECMKKFVSIGSSGQTRSTWIDANATQIAELMNVWANPVNIPATATSPARTVGGILSKIDNALASGIYSSITKCPGKTAISELSRYGTSTDVERMLTERQL